MKMSSEKTILYGNPNPAGSYLNAYLGMRKIYGDGVGVYSYQGSLELYAYSNSLGSVVGHGFEHNEDPISGMGNIRGMGYLYYNRE